MEKLISCAFNMDTACVELRFTDGSICSIDCTAVENEVADNRFQRSELDYLIYNDPLAYADLILNGDVEAVSYTHLDVYKRQEISVARGRKSDTASIEAHPMPHTPAASPSSPSMRFKAFVMPTIQRSVTGTLSAPSAIASAEASPGFVRMRITTRCV